MVCYIGGGGLACRAKPAPQEARRPTVADPASQAKAQPGQAAYGQKQASRPAGLNQSETLTNKDDIQELVLLEILSYTG